MESASSSELFRFEILEHLKDLFFTPIEKRFRI